MSTTHITSLSQLDKLLGNKSKLTVIDFHATWCGPCHMIAPVYEGLAKQYPNVQFTKCDVDAAKEVAARYSIRAMPTFKFLKGSDVVETVQGANKQALTAALQKHAGSSPGGSQAAFSGKGHSLSETANSKPGPGLHISSEAKILLGLFATWGVLLFSMR